MSINTAAAAAPPAPPTAEGSPSSATGLSEFLGGVLSQLSLSSWLPATMLVGQGALLIQMRALHTANIGTAIQALITQPWGILVVLVFALVLATLVTQAFEFEAIRVLEGYVDLHVPRLQRLVARRIHRHRRTRARLIDLLEAYEDRMWEEAWTVMSGPGYETGFREVVRERVKGEPCLIEVLGDVRDAAEAFDWPSIADPATLYKISSVRTRIDGYPAANRIMPTHLGNVLRAVEDRVGHGGDLEGFVMRHHDELPSMVRAEHRDYRTRLDMYCTLTIIFGLLAVFAALLLGGSAPWWGAAGFGVGNLVLAVLAYTAAVASARGYATALIEIDHVARPDHYDFRSTPAESPSASALDGASTPADSERRSVVSQDSPA